MSRKTSYRIHSFTGVFTGLMLFIICWSGSFAVIAYELDWLVIPEMRSSGNGERISWGTVEDSVKSEFPGARVRFIMAPQYDNANYEAIVSMPDYKTIRRVFVDAYSGEVRGEQSFYNTWKFFSNFHRDLFLGKFGEYFATFFSFVLFVSLLSAIVFYRHWWKRFFRLPRGEGRAYWSELHRLAGLWSLWFIAIIALTGAWYFYEHAKYDVGGNLNYIDVEPYGSVQIPEPANSRLTRPLSLDGAVNTAKATWPELEISLIAYGWYSGNRDNVYLQGQTNFPLLRDRANQIHVNTKTGEVLWQNEWNELPTYWVVSNMADPLHFGDFAGLYGKIVYFIFGIALSGIILTGTWMHIKRLVRSGDDRHQWLGVNLSIALSICILIAATYFAIQDALKLSSTVEGVPSVAPLAPGVAAALGVWVLVTITIIAAWSLLLWRPSLFVRDNWKSNKKANRTS
ncbi:MAG: PepSY-associated TM helix domain-containing protein [Pseudomonadota bacterium]